ncbi:serine hydrolase [Pelagibius sp. Alg239-R121]|uniref:serine hydrolase domain-containing protein n=1 Tax=Pelagibius sp. Alg239-R121 TaxID=2993448 RepID=UPI0024A78A45|nr:serine hydrolase [Pelagibius sp. Alg239-R121]
MFKQRVKVMAPMCKQALCAADRKPARKFISIAVVLFLAVLLNACSTPGDGDGRGEEVSGPRVTKLEVSRINTPPTDFNDGWSESSLKAQGIDPAPIARLVKRIRQGGYVGIDSLVLARHGVLVSETYFGGIKRYSLHQTRSSFKSVTGLLVGIAVADGLLDLDEPVAPLIARYHVTEDRDQRKQRITVRNLLQMQSGLDCSEMPGAGPQRESKSNESSDKVAADFDLPMHAEPGTAWHYCSGSTFLLGVALESALVRGGERDLKPYLDGRLMSQLDIYHYSIGQTPKGHLPMHGGEKLRPRDLAKFGQLLLSEGRWRERQVVPVDWVSEILVPGVDTEWSWTSSVGTEAHLQRPSRYRFKWFQTLLRVQGRDYNLIHSWGNGGQFIFAVPDLDLVVVITGSNYGYSKIQDQKQVFHMLRHFILPAVIQ